VDPPLRPRTAALSVVARRRTTESTRLGERVSLEGGSELAAVIAAFQRDMRRLLAACARDPQAPGSEVRHKAFLSVIARTSRQLGQVEQTLSAADLPAARRQFQEAEFEFLEGSENFRHTLAKPLGYAGDFQLLEMLVRNACRSHGLAFHFDQSQLEYPASQACRHRIEWVAAELSATVPRQAQTGLVILDLGIGAAPIEQRWISQHPDLPLRVHAVDLEPAALDYVVRVLAGGPRVVCPWRLNLRDPAVLAQVGEVAAQADACIAVGILEALTDLEAVSLLQTLLRALPSGAVLYAENFVPTHPTRSIMEWFLDFHLSYRSLEQLNSVALRAGADPGRMEMRLDSTGSLALLKLAL